MPIRTYSDDTPIGAFAAPPREIVLIAEPGAGLVAGPASIAAAAADVSPIEAALSGSGAAIVPLFGPSEERVRREVAQAASLTGADAPDLSVYYSVAAPEERLTELAEQLAAADGIAGAYIAPQAEPAVTLDVLSDAVPSPEAAPPASPDFSGRQIYLGPAPAGIDAHYAWTKPGGRGQNVRVCDVEGAWRFDHEDLAANQGGTVGTPTSDLGWRNHGTAVVSVFGGDVNTFGVTGISPDAHTRGFSQFIPGSAAAAITAAANALSAGDILLIELHAPGPGASGAGQDGFIAMEWWPAEWDAIRYATAVRGVIVVEAAGNGARNLDSAIYNTPQAGFPAGWTNPFNRANRDSGAIIVGAGAPPPGTHGNDHGPDRSRLDFSNWGASVDAQGWGREVTACGYGDLQGGADERIWYTDRFSGTSSASPIVVGAVACIQGVRKAQGLAPQTPAQMRTTLRTTGSPQQDAPGRPATQRIGNRPDLREILGPKIKLKKEKVEVKELKEKEIKQELKEKEVKQEIKEVKEVKQEVKEVKLEVKEIRIEQQKNVAVEVKPVDIGQQERFNQIRVQPGGLEQRLAALESAIGQLSHFIPAELRPDLSAGALSDEADLGGGAFKQDVEKLHEGG